MNGSLLGSFSGRISPLLVLLLGAGAAGSDALESNGHHLAPKGLSFASLRSQYLSSTSGAGGNADAGSDPYKQRYKASTPSSASEESPPPERRVKDAIRLLHEKMSKQTDVGPSTSVMDISTDSQQEIQSKGSSSGSRAPAAAAADASISISISSTSSSSTSTTTVESEIQTEELFEITSVKTDQPLPVAIDDSAPASEVGSQGKRQQERRFAFSKLIGTLNRKPPPADAPDVKANEEVPGVAQMPVRRSSSSAKLAESSSGERKLPSRERRQTISHTRPSTSSSTSRPSKSGQQRHGSKPPIRSTTTPSQQADQRRSSRGASSSSNRFSIKSKQDNPKAVSRTTSAPLIRRRRSSSEGLDFDTMAEDPENKEHKTNSSRYEEDDIAESDHIFELDDNGPDLDLNDQGGRLYTRNHHGREHRSKQEVRSSDSSGDHRGPRSMKPKQDHASHRLPRKKPDGNGSFTIGDHIMINGGDTHERQGGLTKDASMDKRTQNVARPHTTASITPQGHRGNAKRATKVSLKGVAAAWYNRGWLPIDGMVPVPEDMSQLNKFLYDCNSEMDAGVPGKFLTVVLGKDNSDVTSIVSTILYAYFLSYTLGSEDKTQCFIPVINMRQEDLVLHTEVVWLFKVSGLDKSNLLFVDQISLQYYHRFDNLKLVLVNHSRLAPHQESLKEAVVEVVHNNLTEEVYSWVTTRDIQEVGSCCTIIAERFVAEACDCLTGRGICRLLLGPLLLETSNLDAKSARCTSRDECMAAFLLNGAGRYGQQGLYRLLKKMQFDTSQLSTMDMLRKDFTQWTLSTGKTDTYGFKGRVIKSAMTTLGDPLKDILNRKDFIDDLKRFEKKFKLQLHVVITGYYDSSDKYQREILLVPNDDELSQHLITCFSAQEEALKLSSIRVKGLPKEMLVFKQGLATASRRVVRQILVDYFSV